MLNALLPTMIILSISLLVFGYKLKNKSINLIHFFYLMLFSLYISSVIAMTLFPFPYQKELIEAMIKENLGINHNLIPFKTIIETIKFDSAMFIMQVGGNILLFIPLGFILSILFPIKKSTVVLIGFGISLTIELIQFVCGLFIGYNYRSFDVDDLILNTLGTIIGLLLYKLFYGVLKKYELLLR
ncbi:VanZ family protein [Bacillus haynesii]|uniref:VanZ family protein n=1 Tax=Bacillus haynesii TaxID=1925021 RepID=UPI0012B8A375|nr:VanZ family protein [Bacillus haynesii]MCY7844012.1 VanZ family protein [Bacillus haynesii]MCY8016349.1 VanZ family protein [Bacillus haynesii]MCY8583751.1 VanZ family protein [Bacillus haynesii]MCY8616412.1 VanZ family protein [Bacillus haynesii]MCY8680047.1 VanZ family protein [Bacillus haynesii]